MGYAIIRMAKIKHASKLRRSFEHAFRERETPNADQSRTHDNTHFGATSSKEALAQFNVRLPDKTRKNAVLAVEYMVTASPESMQGKTRQEQDAYFRDAVKWLQNKHGAENVFYAGIHRDETTPHMYAYAVPIDQRGKLNCRAFYGEKDALSKMQTDFASTVGREHGLERGVEGSKARHIEIKQYYARVKEATPKTPNIDVPEGKLLEGKEAYGQRVAESVIQQLAPEMLATRAKAKQADLDRQAKTALELTLKQREKQLQGEREKTKQNEAQIGELLRVVARGGEDLAGLQRELQEKFEQAKQRREQGQDKGQSR